MEKATKTEQKTSLLTQSLAQAGDAIGVGSVPQTPPLGIPDLASANDRRSGSDRVTSGSLGFSGSAVGSSPSNGVGFGSFLSGSSPGGISYSGCSPAGGSPGSSLEGGVPGRRARRAMRRAAEDAAMLSGSLPRTNTLPGLPPPVPISWEDVP